MVERLFLSIFFAVFAAATCASPVNVLVNSSFEDVDIPANSAQFEAIVPGWGQVTFLFDGSPGGVWPGAGNTGSQYGDMGNNPTSALEQTFTIGAGDVIDSVFWFDNTALTSGTSFYRVQLLGQSNAVLADQSYSTVASFTNWVRKDLTLGSVLGAGTYTLRMFGTTGVGTADSLVDDVTVLSDAAPVPLPAAAILLLSALGLIRVAARRE